MNASIDDLVTRWRDNPTPRTTVALCEALRGSSSSLVEQVGQFATQWHSNDVDVLLSVARMYLDSNRFADAQTVLVAAGKQSPRDGEIYRWLGETLLRRGDAERAEKVLERAIQLGAASPEARLWLERARVFRPMQAKAGSRAVAAEVAHASEPGRELLDSMSEDTTDVHVPRPKGFARPPSTPRAQLASGEVDVAISVVAPMPTSPAAKVDAPASHPPLRARARQQPLTDRATDARPPPAAPMGNGLVPHPRDVLDALTFAGIFEPHVGSSARPATWDAPGKGPKRRGGGALIAGMVFFVAASVGTYIFYQHKRAQDHLQAEVILADVEAELDAARPDALAQTEKELSRALQLESRSPRAALDWTKERATVGLLKRGEDVAFEDAMARAKEVGVPEQKYAFALVASFLFQGDTAGAAAVLPRWDGPAAADAWYQLVAGAALERAGDARARNRYESATKLAPDSLAAQVGLARVTAIAGDSQEAMKLAKSLRAKFPDRAEPVALVALAWGRDPLRDDAQEAAAPPEIEQIGTRVDELPSGLRFVPSAIAALRALDRHAPDDARTAVKKGLAVADSPGAAVWLGAISLQLGDEALARKAALEALQLSAAYEPARALAARVALLGGRLDEALKATEDLDPTSTDVAVVRAAAAYERVDPDGVTRGLDALPPEGRKQPFMAPLALAADALEGRVHDSSKLTALASTTDAPWSDLIAMDVALDSGDLASAGKIAASWGANAEGQPLRAVRLARLARYEGRLDAADALSLAALNSATVTPRILWERAYTLVARGKPGDVGTILARYPLVLGPLATWLSAYASAASGAVDAAKGKTAAIDPPPATAPLEARVVAAVAFGAMKDRRRGVDYVRDALRTGSLHPDLVAAALALGFHRVDHFKRNPTYE